MYSSNFLCPSSTTSPWLGKSAPPRGSASAIRRRLAVYSPRFSKVVVLPLSTQSPANMDPSSSSVNTTWSGVWPGVCRARIVAPSHRNASPSFTST